MAKFIFVFFMMPSLLWAADNKTLMLGEEWLLHGSSRIWVDSDKILSVRPAGTAVSIRGKKEGLSEIRQGSKTIIVRVVSSATANSFAILSERVKKIVGLETDWEGARPVVTGRLHSLNSYVALTKDLPLNADWELHAEIPNGVRQDLEDFLVAKLGPQAPVRPLLYTAAATALFNGSVEAAQKWAPELSRWGIALKRDETAVDPAPVVRVEIAIAEIRKDHLMNLGIKWPSSADATLLPNSTLNFSELIFSAQASEQKGWGRLLARPNILCRSGSEAEFVAGGEFPIRIFNYKIQDVVWKRYGIVLKVKPKADAAGRISLSLETEVSSLDEATKVDGIPGVLTNKVQSQFDLARPRTIVLSGLLKNEDSMKREGLPGLSGLPIIGALFGSSEWKANKTELVVFVRPSIEKEDR